MLPFRGQTPKNIFGARIDIFQPNRCNLKTVIISKWQIGFPRNLVIKCSSPSLRGWSTISVCKSGRSTEPLPYQDTQAGVTFSGMVRDIWTKFGMWTQYIINDNVIKTGNKPANINVNNQLLTNPRDVLRRGYSASRQTCCKQRWMLSVIDLRPN